MADYARHRPRYPRALIGLLREEVGLRPDWVVADVGSGTGLSSEPFLEHGNLVYGIEPNTEMRAAAEEILGGRPRFRSVAGSAEETTLEEASVDLVVAGQAFHWFDAEAARKEFLRILRGDRWAVLVWNTRRAEASPFGRAYEALLAAFGTDYTEVRHDRLAEERLRSFYGGSGSDARAFRRRELPNEQLFDRRGLEGRVRSTSYLPPAGDPAHNEMIRRLREIFAAHAEDGRVRLEYVTEVYVGRLEGP